MKHQDKNSGEQYVNQVKIEFTDKPITAWGGICSLVAKYFEKLQVRQWVEKTFPVRETSPNAKGIYEKVLGQFLTVMTGGYRFAHLRWWGHGAEVIKKCFDVEWLPKDPSSLTRFWGKVNTRKLAEQVAEGGRSLCRQILKWGGIREDNLNMDSSVFTRYGHQEGAKVGYNPKKPGRPSHHPLIAFLGSGYLVNLWNRPGDTHSSHRVVDFFDQTRRNLPEGFQVKWVLADSGFYNVDFFEFLEGKGYHYITAVPIMRVLQKELLRIAEWEEIERGIEIAEFYFQHQDSKWTRPRRYVVVRQETNIRPRATGKQPFLLKEFEETRSYRYSLFITNDEKTAPQTIWEEYRPRAKDENVIKDLREGYGASAFNLHNFWATEAVMVMNGLVFHNLIHFLNCCVLNLHGPVEQLRTLRMKYFILPAQLGSAGRTPVLRMSVKGIRMRTRIRALLEQISLLPWKLNCNAVGALGVGK